MRKSLLHGFGFVLSQRAEYAEALAVAERAEALASATRNWMVGKSAMRLLWPATAPRVIRRDVTAR